MRKELTIPDGIDINTIPTNTWFSLSDPLKEPVPPLEFVIEGYCARGLITVIGGSAGSGKSLFNQVLFQKRNNELLPTKPGKAIYFTGADSSEIELRRRAKAIKTNKGLFTVSLPENQYCVISNDVFLNEVDTHMMQGGFDAVIFDTIADFHEGNLYEAEKANHTMQLFTRLARSTNTAVILITHTRKGSKIKSKYNVEDISDSRIFTTKADFVFGLRSEYQTDKSNLIELQCIKSRSAEAPLPLRASIHYDSFMSQLKISRTDRLFSEELESQSKEEQRRHKIAEVGALISAGQPVRDVAAALNISTGTVVNYKKEYEQQKESL